MYSDDVMYEYNILENDVEMIKTNRHHKFNKCLIGPIRRVDGLLANIIPTIKKIVDDNEVNTKNNIKLL